MADLTELIARVRELDAELPRSVVLPQTVGHIEGLQELRTAAPQLAAECERLAASEADTLAMMARGVELLEDATATEAALKSEVERLAERVRVLEADYDDGGAATNRELARRLVAAEKRVRVLEEALRRVRAEAEDNLIAAIADDALEPRVLVEGDARDKAEAECSRLQERVRVLEELLRATVELAEWMSGSGDFDALGNWAEGRATCNRARAALEGIEVE